MEKQQSIISWLLLTTATAFSLYWISNLMLWYPWILSPALGMVLMLTAGTLLWAMGIFFCLKHYPGEKNIFGALYTALIMLVVSVVADFVFFGLIRGAMTELYHPTTLYGYGFVASLPFLELLIFRKLLREKRSITRKSLLISTIPGIVCISALILIIRL